MNIKKQRKIKTYLKMIFITIANSILVSCAEQSKLYSFYYNGHMGQDVSLLLCSSDSTYIYSNSLIGNFSYKEIGHYFCKKDSIILIPACQVASRDTFYMCRYYDCIKYSDYATQKGNSIIEKPIVQRIYLKNGKEIKDCTLEHYFPNDSNAFTGNEEFPLYRQDIKQSEKEKSILYTRKYLNAIY